MHDDPLFLQQIKKGGHSSDNDDARTHNMVLSIYMITWSELDLVSQLCVPKILYLKEGVKQQPKMWVKVLSSDIIVGYCILFLCNAVAATQSAPPPPLKIQWTERQKKGM